MNRNIKPSTNVIHTWMTRETALRGKHFYRYKDILLYVLQHSYDTTEKEEDKVRTSEDSARQPLLWTD
jgi:hypothetical protein